MIKYANTRIYVTLVIGLVLFCLWASPALAAPPQPQTVYGVASLDGTPAPDGTTITAWVDNGGTPLLCGTGTVAAGVPYGAGQYTFNVIGDDPDKPGKDGAYSGDTVTYRVAGNLASETTTWASGFVYTNLTAYSPTAVTLATFAAAPAQGGIELAWETASEIDNLGFNVCRGEPRVKLNASLIPAQALGSVVGARYAFLDDTAQPGVAYTYWLEAVSLGGEVEVFGPVTAQATAQLPSVQLLNKKDRVNLLGKLLWFKTVAKGSGLQEVYLAFADSPETIAVSPQVRYTVGAQAVQAWNGTHWSDAKTPNGGGWAHCPSLAVRMLGYGVTWLEDGSLQLQWPIRFKDPFVGAHRVYIRAVGAGGDSGWTAAGSITISLP